MRIACPDCGAAYDVPADRVPPGRGVRCAKCGVVWTPVATVDAKPEIVPAPDRLPADAGPADAGLPDAGLPDAEPPSAGLPGAGLPGAGPAGAGAAGVGAAEAAPMSSDGSAPALPPRFVDSGIERVDPPAPTPEREPGPRKPRPTVALGWLVTAAVLGALGWFLVARRAEIMQAWPPSERAYAWFRLVP